MRRWRRLLPLLAIGALLAMHGLDSTTTAAHAEQAAPDMSHAIAAHEMTLAGAPGERMPGLGGLLGHLTVVCVSMLLAATSIGVAALCGRRLHRIRLLASPPAPVVGAIRGIGRPPPPGRLAVCIARC